MTHLAAALALAALAAGPCDPEAPASLWQKTLHILGIPANPGAKGPKTVKVIVGYQTCNHMMCLPPTTEEFELTLK